MIKPPCYKCNSRCVGCHNKCEKYASYKAELAEIRTKEFYSRCDEKIISEYEKGKTKRLNKFIYERRRKEK
jgi:cupin superfamily acireductone dioxygenase involved in methionine salvage